MEWTNQMNPLTQFFGDRVFCINVASRRDRWEHVLKLEAQFGLPITRFDAVTHLTLDGQYNGNLNCTASHRALLDLMVESNWPNMFVFEDDFDILHTDFNDKACRILSELPEDWDMVYLGGHYGERPLSRHSPHLIRCGRFLTTSSYGISLKMAVKMRESITGVGPIDSLYGGFHRDNLCYVADPRLVVQYPNASDLQGGRFMDNSQCMLDKASAVPVGE